MTTRFLERLRVLQGDASDAEFARRCGVKYTTMKNYLTGRNLPPLDVAGHIAATYGVSIDWLFGLDVPSPNTRSTQVVETIGEIIKLVGDTIAASYRDAKVKLPGVSLVSEIARYYPDLIERMEEPGDVNEAKALMPWLENRIRKELHEAAAAPGTGKRSA
ncbi:helix-turn-helix domain-containing protein [Mesorhizobium sp. AR07]|uniref:helix-turn-helix domain-containing protein n=1 Tax=Mesorhizobium sp. AR07 TaxID=2865838 RepID=UPI00215E9970|nr:helix-turn-helix transcriptional regulator [Mesorhizobium sp. AR07]UVK45332.1 helix-turn-helix domain-containing protein [Mesorhizobium sp. AR07]